MICTGAKKLSFSGIMPKKLVNKRFIRNVLAQLGKHVLLNK